MSTATAPTEFELRPIEDALDRVAAARRDLSAFMGDDMSVLDTRIREALTAASNLIDAAAGYGSNVDRKGRCDYVLQARFNPADPQDAKGLAVTVDPIKREVNVTGSVSGTWPAESFTEADLCALVGRWVEAEFTPT